MSVPTAAGSAGRPPGTALRYRPAPGSRHIALIARPLPAQSAGAWSAARIQVSQDTRANSLACCLARNDSHGVLIKDDRIINTQLAFQTGISVGHMEYAGGDVPDGNAIVRNNIGCYPMSWHQRTHVRVIAPNSTLSKNLSYSGAAGSTGACALAGFVRAGAGGDAARFSLFDSG